MTKLIILLCPSYFVLTPLFSFLQRLVLSSKASPLKRCEEMATQGGLFLNNNSFSAGINCDLQIIRKNITSLTVRLNWNVSFSVLLFFFQIIIAFVILIGVYILIIFEV